MVTYRTDDAEKWGAGKGANLTASEIDGNFWDLLQRLVSVEENPTKPNQITSIAVTGTQMVVHMADATTHGPFTLPSAMIHYRGDWAAGVDYAELDVVAAPDEGGIFLVARPHVAAAAFDPTAVNANGEPLYQWLFPVVGSGRLSAAIDVSDAAPADGDALVWDAATETWGPGSGSAALAGLSDVAILDPIVAQFLRFDGSAWINVDLAWDDIAGKPDAFAPAAHSHAWGDVSEKPALIEALPAAVGVEGQVLKVAFDGSVIWAADETGSDGTSGSTSFLGLSDTPAAFGAAGQVPVVNAAGDGLVFEDPTASGLSDAPADGEIYARKDGGWMAIPIDPPDGYYSHWRMRLVGEDHILYAGSIYIGEIQFRSAAGVGETMSGGSVLNSGWSAAAEAFDGAVSSTSNAHTSGSFNGKHLGYIFPEPREIKEVALIKDPYMDGAPKHFVIEASNDGVTWDQLVEHTRTGLWSGTLAFPITPPPDRVDWPNVTNKPEAFPAEAHSHSWAEITEKPTILAGAPAAFGASGQVLKVNEAGDGWVWGDDIAGSGGGLSTISPKHKGALARLLTTWTGPASTFYAIPWDTEVRDTDGFFDPAAPARLTVPAGVTKVRLRGGIDTIGVAESVQMYITPNGGNWAAAVASGLATGTGLGKLLTMSSPTIDVVEGDFFELYIQQAEVQFDGSPATFFEIEVIEGSVLDQAVVAGAVSPVAEKAAAYTFAMSDAGTFVDYNSADPGTFTIPDDATVDFPIGAIIAGGQIGAGALVVAAAAGVTLNGVIAGSAALNGQWSEFSIRKRAANNWIISGAFGNVA